MVSVHEKVAIGMSGGVDSSVAAALLKEQGFDVCAITMVTYDGSEPEKENQRHGCYGPGEAEDVASAESVCKKLDISLHVIDLREEYQTHVIGHFRNEYLAGRTPNPCVVCNREVKFGLLLEKARKSGVEFDFFATGHYAIIERSGGRYSLKRAKDHSKDQSYFLYTLTPDQLSTTLFPLGTYKKPQVREIARSLGLQTSERPESQDFVANGNYGILFNKDDATEGDLVDGKGNVLGKHRGIIHYTIGQRRGLGIAYGRPLYVTKIDAKNNRIVVSGREDLSSKGFIASDLNLIAIERLDSPLEASVKIRLNHAAVEAVIFPHAGEKARILFNKPQEAVCPGQHAVFYKEETVIGGGVIEETL